MLLSTKARMFEKGAYFWVFTIMPRVKRLTEFGKEKISSLSSSGLNSSAIAKKIGRSKTVVNNFLNLNDNYGKRNSGGSPKALSSRKEWTVLRLASTGKYPSMEIIKQTGLNVCRKLFTTILNELVICNMQ